MKKSLFILIILFSVLNVCYAAQIIESEIMVPINIDGKIEFMDARIYRQATNIPMPLIILTHGTPTTFSAMRESENNMFNAYAQYFVEKNYVVVTLLRGGFGKTTFGYIEDIYENGVTNIDKGNMIAANQIKSAIEFFQTKSYVNKHKVNVIGLSTGGISAVALGTLNIYGLKTVISFSGGRGSNNLNLYKEQMIDAVYKYGSQSKIPNLWLYAATDTYFPPYVSNDLVDSYKSSGGNVQFKMFPSIPVNEGHMLFFMISEWYDTVFNFLRLHN